jgi:signal transduction histidine kinase
MLLDVPFDQKQIAQLFDLQPDAVIWYIPIFKTDSERIVDFEVRYCNSAASRIFNVPVKAIIGTRLSVAPFIDDTTRNHIFQQCTSVWLNGNPVEFTYYSPLFQRYFNVQRSKAINGILSVTRDRTTEVIAEQEKERQSLLLNKIANSQPTLLALCEGIANEKGFSDFHVLMVNDKMAASVGHMKEDLEKKTIARLSDKFGDINLVTILREVLLSDTAFRDELHLPALGGWFLLTANKVDKTKVILVLLDINESKKDKIALQDQAEWFNNILSYCPSGIVALESVRNSTGEIIDFEITLANKAGKAIGALPAQPVGKRLLDIFPHLLSNGVFNFHKKVVDTGEPFRDDLLIEHAHGAKWVQLTLVRLNDGLIANMMDISELKQYEQTIRAHTEELQSILNASLNGVFACEAILDTEGQIRDFQFVKINASFTRILKLEEKDVIGKLYSEVFPAARELGMINLHRQVIESGIPKETELYYKDDKIEGWYLLSINKWGETGVVQTFQDYTSMKQLQQQLELTIQGLKRSNERLTEFSHVASHDLNEPLRKVITFSKLLTDKYGETLDAGARDYLDRIEKTAFRMQALLENLLIYSRVSKQIHAFEQVSLNVIVQEVVTDLETFLLQKKAKIRVDNLPVISGEKAQLRQLFQNLITNAVKFQRPDNIPELTIRNATDTTPDTVKAKSFHVVEVRDNGIGFDPAEAERIFQLFHRLHARHEFEGTGIGLAIVQRAMENHHGFVEATSEPGKGSTFRLYFPKP